MSLKRKLTQDDLRKAMSEHKKKLGIVKKIDSPLAKYPFDSLVVQLRLNIHFLHFKVIILTRYIKKLIRNALSVSFITHFYICSYEA